MPSHHFSDITLILHCGHIRYVVTSFKINVNSFLKWGIYESGPEGLRSLGSPVMSRLLYQAELRAPRKKGSILSIKCYRVNNKIRNNYQVTNFVQKLILLQFRIILPF